MDKLDNKTELTKPQSSKHNIGRYKMTNQQTTHHKFGVKSSSTPHRHFKRDSLQCLEKNVNNFNVNLSYMQSCCLRMTILLLRTQKGK